MNIDPVSPFVLTLAAAVIARADREHPADQVLRATLKDNRRLLPGESLRVARAVFAYFRWRGWLDEGAPLPEQINRAVELAARFTRQPRQFPDVELAARAVPPWTRQEVDVNPSWLRSLQTEPKLWLRTRPGQGRGLAERLGRCRLFGSGLLGDTLEYQGDEDLFRTAEFHAGAFEVQDLSSQAVGFICAPRPGETWWDACAGEGGKTLHLSDLMGNRGSIWATDRAAWRLDKLKRRAARARLFNYRMALWQHIERLPTKTRFDGVLVDAPCTGVGTWQRNPHARWTVGPGDVQELAALQKKLLASAARAVKPGGTLIYSVCTHCRSETSEVAESFERESPGFQPGVVPHPLDASAPPGARLMLWPHEWGGNGMFIAVWKRR